MNRKLLALAVGAAFALPMAAQAAPTLYGLVNLSIDKVEFESTDNPATLADETEDNFKLNSNSSRIGVMGEESLTGSLSAIYKAEWGVSGDGNAADLNQRNRYVGLKGGFGTIKLGHYDSPLKESQGGVDQFNDMTYLDMGNFVYGENRVTNLIGYESPKFGDMVSFKVVIQPGESNNNDGIAEAVSASVAYEANGLYVALAGDQKVSSGNFNEVTARDAIRLTATYASDMFQVGAMVQTSETSDDTLAGTDDETSYLLSGAYLMGANTLKGQLVMANNDFGGGFEVDTQAVELGFDHNFTQMTKVFGQLGWVTYDANGGGNKPEDTVVSVGMQTKF